LLRYFLAIVLLTLAAVAQPSPARNAKAAQSAFESGIKLEKKHPSEALQKLDLAVQLDPTNSTYLVARELLREKLAYERLQQGDADLAAGRQLDAAAEFQAAAALEPSNETVRQRLRDALPDSAASRAMAVVSDSREINLRPAAGVRDLHLHGDSRSILEQLATSFGLTALFDDNFPTRAMAFDLTQANFATAIALASSMSKTMWVPVSSSVIFFAPDTPANHQQFDHLSLRTFYFPDISTPQEMNDLTSTLRGIFELRYVIANPAQSLITVRAPKPVLDQVTIFLQNLATGRPQVMLDIQAFEVNRDRATDVGVQLPLQFQLINLTSVALAAAAAIPNIQQQIQQIIANGGLTPENQAAIAALLAQLQSLQNSQIQQLINQPFATFGGGLTRFAVIIPPVSGSIQFNTSAVNSLEHVTLRAAQGDTATMRIGSRFPVLTSIFSASTTNPLAQFVNTGAAQTTNPLLVTPSFNYEDLGITVKAKPHVHMRPSGDSLPVSNPPSPATSAAADSADISLDLELAIRALGATSFNGIPVITNREFKGSVRLKDGETAMVAGSITRSELRSLSGLPGLGALPVLNHLLSSNTADHSEDEILIVITPHIMRAPTGSSQELWLPPI
jgi:hypothetical protein